MVTLNNNGGIYYEEYGERGSVGGFFMFNGDNSIYGITNRHVLAPEPNPVLNRVVKKLNTNDAIGNLEYWVNLNQDADNQLDIALFKLGDNSQISYKWYGPRPVDYIEPRFNGHVKMVTVPGGASRGVRQGVITNICSSTVYFNIGGKHYPFSGLVEVTSMDYMPFSLSGDSGSLILNNDNYAVGVLMGVDKKNKRKSFIVPFVNGILNTFGLQIAP